MNYKSSNKLFYLYYFISICIVLILGLGTTISVYKNVNNNSKENLLQNVASISNALEINDIKALSGSLADIDNVSYISIKNKLEKIRSVNEDIRFIYLWGYRDENPFFFVDSEPSLSEDYSPPGQVYGEATELDRDILLGRHNADVEFSTDRWGSWLTALVPIIEDGKVIAVMGMDMSSENFYRNVYTYTAIPLLSTIFILILIIVGFILRKREVKYMQFKEKLINLATHDMRSPLTGISWLSETMLGNKEKLDPDTLDNLEKMNTKIKTLLVSVNAFLDSHDKNTK